MAIRIAELLSAPSSPKRTAIASTSEAPQQSLVETKLVASNGVQGDQFGYPLAVGGDVLVVGAPNATIEGRRLAGALYVFLRSSAVAPWVEHKRLVPNDGDFHSSEMCIAIDGDTLVAGAPYATLQSFQEGAAYIFERKAGGDDNWGQVAKLTDLSVGFGGHFGCSIAIRGDLLVVGASASSQHHGRVEIFERDRGGAGNWGLVTTLSYGAAQDAAWVRAFGSAVALDGDLLLIGAEDTDVSYFYMADGAAYLFRRNEVNPDQWDYVTRLISPGADQCVGGRKLSDFSIQSNPEENTEAKRCALEVSRTANDDFGCAVLLQGDLAVIGARFAEGEDGSYGVGAVHVFRRDENGTDQWINVATLTPKETTGGAYFGTALALAGDTLIVGAPGTNIGQGKAYVFERNAGGSDQWGETGQLAPSDGVSNADFGKSIALDDEASIVGAMGDGNWRGAVYVFAPPISPEPPSPAFPPTGELVNGGIVEGLNGVLLGALEGTLSQPLAIWIQEVEAPAQALWPLATPVGSFYNIGAVTTTVAPQEQEFGLAMPVPDGADTAHLGIALLGPRSRLLDDLGAEDEWLPIPGYYESESRLFSIALSYLFIEGSIVVLVEHPNLVPLSLPSAQTPSASPQLRSLTIQDADFSVKCGNFTDAGQCLPEDERTFEKRLQDTYDKYTGLGYSGPALHHGIMTVNLLGIKNFIRIETAEYTGNQINDGSVEPCVSGPKAQYMTVARIMTFCYQRDHDDDVTVGSETRHEMFHAFQHHFEALSRDVLNATQGVDLDNVLPSQKPAIENYGWIVEGTAAAAEDSAETMTRSRIHERLLHPINVALTASHLAGNTDPAWIEYRAQDFWVYFGLKKNLGLIYLKTLFAYGATPAGADQFFIIEHGTSLGAEYWGWVKNQAVEKTFDSDRRLGNPGQINLEATGTPRGLLYLPRDQLPSVEGTLPRLTSEVVQIVFSAGEIGETSYTVTVAAATVSGAANGLAYKVYKQGETDFAVKENEPRTFVQEPLPFVVYVILSNVQYQPENSLSYRVSVFKS